MDQYAPTSRPIHSGGFTLLELMVCTTILLIVALAVGPALVGAQRNWEAANESVRARMTRDGRAARIALQRAARRASLQNITVGPDGDWVDLPYYDSPDSTQVDRYARLSWVGGCLSWREGLIDERGQRQMLTDTVLCGNVFACVFAQNGASIRMKATFTEGTTQMTVVAAALTNKQ